MIDDASLTRAIASLIPEFENRFIRPFAAMVKDTITSSQLNVMLYLNNNETATMSGLASHLDVSRPQLTCTVDGLEALNYVQRTPDSFDRRKIVVRLTDKGIFFLRETQQRVDARLRRKLAPLSEQERDLLYQSIVSIKQIVAKTS